MLLQRIAAITPYKPSVAVETTIKNGDTIRPTADDQGLQSGVNCALRYQTTSMSLSIHT